MLCSCGCRHFSRYLNLPTPPPGGAGGLCRVCLLSDFAGVIGENEARNLEHK